MAFWVAGIRSARSWRHSPRPAGGCWAGARQQGGQPSHRYWVVLSIVPSTWASAAFIRVEAGAELPHRQQQEQDAQGLAQIARRTVLTGPLGPAMAKTTAPTMADTGRTRRKQVHWLDAGSDELLAALRVLNGFDIDVAAGATRLASRLRDALTSIAPALERAVGDRLHQAGVRDLLAAYPALTALRAASQSRIERTVKARSPRIAAKVTTAVAAALAAQDVTVPAEAATGRVIAELADDLDRVCARRDALAAEIEEAFLTCPSGELLASMPGIGPRAGARILAEIGDGPAFATGSKLAAYAGLAPVTRQSGTSLAGETRSRRGNHRLKNAMFLAAFASLRDPASKAFYDRKRTEGKRHTALICLARRRCDVFLAMLRTGQHYQPARPAPSLPKAA